MEHPSCRLALPLLLAACAAAPWQPPPEGMPIAWRDRDVYYGPGCVVIASSGSGAIEVHTLVDEVAAAIAAETGAKPPPGLVLALAADDPLPVEPVAAWFDALCDLHARATGTPPRKLEVRPPRTRKGNELALDPALIARLIGTAVPGDDETLGLPRELRERASFVAVLPTRSCLEDVADAILDAGLDAEGASFFERALIAPFRGRAIEPMVEEGARSLRAVLLAAWLPAAVRDGAQFDRVCARAGVRPAVVRGTASGGLGADGDDAAPDPAAQVRTAPHDPRLHAAPPPAGYVGRVYAALSFTHFVDVGRARNERFAAAAREAGKPCAHVPVRSDPPGRDDADRLAAALPTGAGTRALVFGDSLEQVALLLGAHAYWTAGREAGDAVHVAVELGASGSGVAAFGRSLPAVRQQPGR